MLQSLTTALIISSSTTNTRSVDEPPQVIEDKLLDYLLSIDSITDIINFIYTNGTVLPNATKAWQFDNNTDDDAFNDDATIVTTEGINGTALLLDGDQDFVQTNATNATTYIYDMSIAAWVKPNYTQGSPEFTVISKGESFVLSINNIVYPKHIAKFVIFDGIKWTTVESNSTIPDNSWT